MKNKLLSFVGGKKAPGGRKEKIIEEKNIGNLKLIIMEHGVIHVFDDKKDLLFKKNADSFEDEIEKIDFTKMAVGDKVQLDGSGDNDHLVFERTEEDVKIYLKKRGFESIEKLKELLKLGIKQKETA